MSEDVYFIRNPHTGLIKVGYSSQVDVRFRTLCHIERAPLELLGSIPGDRFREQRFHKAMAAFRDHGEWFHPNTLLDAYEAFFNAIPEGMSAWSPRLAHAVDLELHPDRITGTGGLDYWGEWMTEGLL
jgi:hypothetical protein